MSKLWEKNYRLNSLIEKYTVGIDYKLDKSLVIPDCIASMAHAVMLSSINIITNDELLSLKKGLISIIKETKSKKFKILPSDEDCHTAIENYLVKKTGDAGKKIHTGRSRNDQILGAVRIFTRNFLLEFMLNVVALSKSLLTLAEKNKNVPMPGRTHMQIAMPSSVGLWAASFAEDLIDNIRLTQAVYDFNNMSPLGSAAGYGVPLPINRELTAELLGFTKVQRNVLYVSNSRGKVEAVVLDNLDYTGITLSKMAQDLIIFSMPEFGYFSIPSELCSGSSIMPNKKNPDGLELIRAKSETLSSYASQIKNIIRSLPSGYNRDFQETKEPFLKGTRLCLESVQIMDLTIQKLEINKSNLLKGFSSEIFATDAALELVQKGKSFREAYREIGLDLENLKNRNPEEAIGKRKHTGGSGNLNIEKARKELQKIETQITKERERLRNKIMDLTGFEVLF